jgi:hypothetical protein
MIEKLEQILSTNNLLEKKKIKELNKSCCKKSNIEVIDFDYVKDRLCSQLGINSLSSCDALYLCRENKKVFLIELKSFTEWLTEFQEKKKSNCSDSDFINFFYEDMKQEKKIENKIFDSVLLIASLGDSCLVDKSFYKSLLDKSKSNTEVSVNFIFATNLSSQEYMQYQLASLSSRFKYKFLSKLSFVLCSDLEDNLG